MARNDGRPDLQDLVDPAEAEGIIAWVRAALVRAVKTAAQAAVAAVPTSALTIGTVDWRIVAGTAALSAILSLLTSTAGIPEVDQGANITQLGTGSETATGDAEAQ